MRVFVGYFGCSASLADCEVLRGCLVEAGVELVGSVVDADVLVFNTCAVKGPTENRVIDVLKRVPLGKKLVVAGCLPVISFERLRREVRFDGVVGPAAGRRIVSVVERVAAGEYVVELAGFLVEKPCLDLPCLRSSSVVDVVPVSYGCLGSCAYCCVTQARGRLRSCSVEEVVERFQRGLAVGVKEFWLTSQDMACYGRDIGVDLAKLVSVLGRVEGDFRLRVGMMTPNMVTPILDELVEAFRSVKVFKFLHLPVQSGDDSVLKRMRRFYSVAEFEAIVRRFRSAFPEVTVATDVICGFPGETVEAFENTVELVRRLKPDVVNVSKFFARPGTVAADMEDGLVDKLEIKRRSAVMAALAKQLALERNQSWVGWSGGVLVDEKGKVAGSWVGRNFAYKPVAVKTSADLLGKTVEVKVVKAFATHLLGELLM